MDFLSLRSHPASLSSRIYFSFVLCFELFASKLSSFSCKPPIIFSQVSISSFFTLRLYRAPDVHLHLLFHHTKHKHLFTNLTFSSTFVIPCCRHHDNQHPTLSRSARTTRRSLPLLSPDPTTHMARNRARLRSSLA